MPSQPAEASSSSTTTTTTLSNRIATKNITAHKLSTEKPRNSIVDDDDSDDPSINYFPHLPPYACPKTGLLSLLPEQIIPYAQLMRLDKPAGLYAFFFPYLIGLAYSSAIFPHSLPPSQLFHLALVLLPFNILLRGAACTWNDALDRRFDRKVARCRHRPVARGAVSPLQAYVFTLAQLVGLFALQKVFLPNEVVKHTIFMVLLFGVYAYLKRITYYPQVELGVAFAWAVFFTDALLPRPTSIESSSERGKGTVALFTSIVLWTIVYDTIYAHQDIADDEKAGVKGMALLFKESNWLDTKRFSGIFTVLMGGLLAYIGIVSNFGTVYFVGTVGGVLATMVYYIVSVDLKVPESCGMWFHRQFWIVGAGYVSGFLGEYIVRRGGF